MNFGEILKNLIEENNLTQKELAKRLNLAPSTLGGYVQGLREPDYSTLKLLANYFNVSIDYLLNNYSGSSSTNNENELLRVFRSLTDDQQLICIEQCKVFAKFNHNKNQIK